ncbi:MAG: GNAT family N-acetyltransferase [Planktomarina sp.]
MTLRLAIASDVPAIQQIVQDAYAPHTIRMGQTPGPMLDDYAVLIVAGHVRVSGDPIQGILVLIPAANHMLLDNGAIAKDAQGQGLGTQLVQSAMDIARASGHQTLRLYCHITMVENMRLYRRLGFVETHRVTEYGLDRVYFESDLTLHS